MFQEMRKKDREASRPEAEAILAQGMYGVLSMNAGDDYAYGVPFSYVYLNNSLYLHCALEGKKLTYLRRHPKVSFCVVGEAAPDPDKYSMKYQSVIAFGRAIEVNNREEKVKILIDLVKKYYTDAEHIEKGKEVAANFVDKTVVIRIEIDHLTGKAKR